MFPRKAGGKWRSTEELVYVLEYSMGRRGGSGLPEPVLSVTFPRSASTARGWSETRECKLVTKGARGGEGPSP